MDSSRNRMGLLELPVEEIDLSHYGQGRKIEVQEFECLTKTIQTFGQTTLLIVDQDDKLVVGYKQLKAMRACGVEYAICNQLTMEEPDRALLSIILNYMDKDYDLVEMSRKLKLVLQKYTIAQVHLFVGMPSHDLRDIEKLLDWSVENYKPKVESKQIGLDL